ncbi:T6SS effector BTH_I2691 family protein [Achromobacter spanius]|uniref:T6SS effector BTH_I2691 family protein n=1 Tax=Achromobacter spanius TaxID=217203 RepID=UPI0023EEE3CE|nr:T6SS effector BTH_I2691 family protein [Achromobacter spanius]
MTTHPSLKSLLPKILRIADKTRCDAGPSAVVACKSEVAILPLRYAVLTDADPALEALAPALPPHLASGLPPLQGEQARYAVRTMRRGYLYLFTKRFREQWSCESAYRTYDSGLLKRVFPYAPQRFERDPIYERPASVHDLHGSAESGPGGWTLCLKAPEDIEELRALFTPDPLTTRMLNLISSFSPLRNQLQAFDIRKLLMSCSRAPDVLDPSIIDDTLADAIAQDQPNTAAVLASQLYSDPENGYARHIVALDLKESARRARGFGIVLHDAIGITQQLNSWRNDAYETVQRYLDKKDDKGIENQRKVLVAQAFIDVKQQFESRSAALEAQHFIDIERARVYDPGMAAGRNWILNDEERKRWDNEADQYITQFEDTMRAKVQAKLDSGEYLRRFHGKYLSPAKPGQALRVEDMDAELKTFDAVSEAAEAIGAKRAKNHELWLASEQLLIALDVYDDRDLASGWRFAGQTGLCVLGADGCKSTADLIEKWWTGNPSERANLAMRGFALNQTEIQAELQRTREEARIRAQTEAHDPVLSNDRMIQQVHAGFVAVQHLADLFDKANGLFEALAAAGETNLAGGALAWYSSLGRQSLRYGSTGKEWFLHGITRSWLAASISKRATNMRIDELTQLGRSTDPKQLRAQIGRNTRFAFATELVDAHRSDFYKLRASSWLLFFEAALIALRVRDMPSDERGVGELIAHGLLAGAAGTEILAAGTGLVLGHYSAASATGRGATVFQGQLKLVGGALAAVGGVVLMGYDWEDARKSKQEAKPIVAFTYYVRFASALAMVGSQSSIAFAAAGPMLKILAERGGKSYALTSLLLMAARASSFLGRAARLALLRSLLLRSTLIGIAATVAIAIFDDNALEKWCKRSTYRGIDYQGNSPHKALENELADLYSALLEII